MEAGSIADLFCPSLLELREACGVQDAAADGDFYIRLIASSAICPIPARLAH